MNIMDGALISGRLGRIADALDRMSPPEPKSLGEISINIKINKEEILRDLEEIRKAAEEVAKLLEALKLDQQPVYPYVPVWPYPGNWTITCGGGGTHQ